MSGEALCMKNTAVNPYLPSYEYVPDGEPRVFGGRLYIFGSHDKFNGDAYCLNDYVCYSASVDDLSDWHYEGVIYRKTDDPNNSKGRKRLYAPDVVQGPDGRYYLYYALDITGRISVAVCDSPAGQYRYLGDVHHKDDRVYGVPSRDEFAFDPGVLVDDDNRIWLYSGFGSRKFNNSAYRLAGYIVSCLGPDCMELESDMLTIKTEPVKIIPGAQNGKGTSFEGHEFFEASSIRKFNGKYYFIYSSMLSHELAYAVSTRPNGGFVYGGPLYSNGDIGLNGNTIPHNYWGNNHGSIVKIGECYYIFGHRQTNYHEYSRQGVAEEIHMGQDGSFAMVEMTSCGLNRGPLPGNGVYEASIACNLYKAGGACKITEIKNRSQFPGITQSGEDREGHPDAYVENVTDGVVVGYKYFLLKGGTEISVEYRGNACGILHIMTDSDTESVANIQISPQTDWGWSIPASVSNEGTCALYFVFSGNGSLDLRHIRLGHKR